MSKYAKYALKMFHSLNFYAMKHIFIYHYGSTTINIQMDTNRSLLIILLSLKKKKNY